MKRGECWWADWPANQRHPVVLLSWDSHGTWRDQVTIAVVTSSIRNVDAEVALGPADGMPRECVVNLNDLATVSRSVLDARICALTHNRMGEVERAIHLALGMALPCKAR
ncbi:MAG: type II toxin-antitoxin system PemK/MazF family toxin [Acidimicrobiales bacterium]